MSDKTLTDYEITPLGDNPKTNFHQTKIDIEQFAANQLIEYSGVIGNMAALYPVAQHATEFPGVPIHDFTTPVAPIAGNAAAAAVSIYNAAIKEKAEHAKAQVALKNVIIIAFGKDNLASLSDPRTGLRNVSVETIFQFGITKFGTLTKADLAGILHNLTVPMTQKQSFDKLAGDHINWHNQALAARNIISEYEKISYLKAAFSHRADYMKAYDRYMEINPLLVNQTFAGLRAYVELQAPNMTTASDLYARAATKTIDEDVFCHPAFIAMAAQMKDINEKLARLSNKGGGKGKEKNSYSFYCYVHGYNNSHAGHDCKVMKGDTTQYTNDKTQAKKHTEVTNGSTKNM